MTDLDLLTGTIAARLRLLPDVARLYPTRTGLDGIGRTISGLLDAVADDPAVTIRPLDGAYLIETTVGIAGDVPAREAAAAVRGAIRDTCTQNDILVRQVRVRVATVG